MFRGVVFQGESKARCLGDGAGRWGSVAAQFKADIGRDEILNPPLDCRSNGGQTELIDGAACALFAAIQLGKRP